MCEALIGAVAFHTTTIQALRVAGFIIGIGKNEMQVLIQGHKMGYVPYCVTKQLDENDPILTTKEALQRISILEGIQQWFPRFSFPVDTITVLSPWLTCPSTRSCRESPYYNYQVEFRHFHDCSDSRVFGRCRDRVAGDGPDRGHGPQSRRLTQCECDELRAWHHSSVSLHRVQ